MRTTAEIKTKVCKDCAMKAGLVYLERGFKPFKEYREITKGPNRGKVQVQVAAASNSGIRYQKRIVSPEQIRRYPAQ